MFLYKDAHPSNVGRNTRKKGFKEPSPYQKWLQPFFWENFSHRSRKRCRKHETEIKEKPEPLGLPQTRLFERFGLEVVGLPIPPSEIDRPTSEPYVGRSIDYIRRIRTYRPLPEVVGTVGQNTRKMEVTEPSSYLDWVNPFSWESFSLWSRKGNQEDETKIKEPVKPVSIRLMEALNIHEPDTPDPPTNPIPIRDVGFERPRRRRQRYNGGPRNI